MRHGFTLVEVLVVVGLLVMLTGCDKEKPQTQSARPQAETITPQEYRPPNPNQVPKWQLDASTQFGTARVFLVPSPSEFPYQPNTWSGMGGSLLWTLAILDDGTWQVTACLGNPGGLFSRQVGYWQLPSGSFNPSAPNLMPNPALALLPVTVTPL